MPIINGQFPIQRYARFLLVLFVISATNMSLQLPAHASMQWTMASAMGAQSMSDMSQMNIQNCECPPAMCETVSALDKLGGEIPSVSFAHLLAFQSLYAINIEDSHHQPSVIRLSHHNWQFRQFAPPPLSLSTVLHI